MSQFFVITQIYMSHLRTGVLMSQGSVVIWSIARSVAIMMFILAEMLLTQVYGS